MRLYKRHYVPVRGKIALCHKLVLIVMLKDKDYRAVKIRSTEALHGVVVALINLDLQLETEEVLEIQIGEEFEQAIVPTDL